MTTDVRALFLSTADTAVRLIAHPAVGRAWDGPSALPEFSVRGLAGHLAGQIFALPTVLALDAATSEPISVLDHYLRAKWREPEVPLDDPSKVKARDSGESHAADGQDALVRRAGDAVRDLADALTREAADRVVPIPWAGTTLTLDGFITTRLLELVVHCDDLAVSVGIDTPELDPDAVAVVLDVLLKLSVDRHGPMSVLRALSRAERAPAHISAL
ncbi:maleylpyruvate isomerase N-terminal domain-containing protein [Actinokineospora fastidiosa]|uniref:Mycothiol-dependent maleylpyruvate isomerase metal-binding domain-containing protein n=1 Tax=Actinokineospora fastidiosa TaxID=1816 RepID=A0A918GRA6_9PSEU|nr:maleylpyruvate isomerase N-terminal domain-containing protein [Actinokineospora fastidiosa]GGS55757.1 hypothetical protein GCM10010171_58350 [Actinokineospora fastidiosa]